MNAERDFRDAIAAAGLVPPDEVTGDGELHRFSATGRRRDDAGWYVLYLDSIPAGAFGDWRSNEKCTWCAKADNQMTPAERRAVRQRVRQAQLAREEDKLVRETDAAKTAAAKWQAAMPAIAHAYLSAKGVRAHGVRVDDAGLLLVPLRDADGTLRSLQTISLGGEKRFLPGGKVRGCYHSIGRPSGSIVVCEGYATGATIFEATQGAVAVAFNAGNLERVARVLRAKYPCLAMVIAADDDWKTAGNPGLAAAQRAALAVGGTQAVPDFTGLQRGEHDTDFNDLARLAGAMEPYVQLSTGALGIAR